MKPSLLRHILVPVLLALALGAHARTYLVSVGITDYSAFPGKCPDLNLTVRDAGAVAELYRRNGNAECEVLLNQSATRVGIVKAIRQTFAKAAPDDIVVLFFSGHGYPGGFCASNGKLGYDEIRRAMAVSRCRNKMIFADACHSGALRVDPKASGRADSDARNSNVMLFLSSRNTETSIERRGMDNGFFTTFLIRGLKGGADADRNRVITARELFDFVHREVTRISTGKQHPVMWGKFDDSMPVLKW